MPNNSAIVLLTRPRSAAERFAADLPQWPGLEVQILISPLLRIRPLPAQYDLSKAAGVIFTSANAVEYADASIPLPAYCVGGYTRRRAEAAGWSVVTDAPNADRLYADLLHRKIKGPLVHLAGRHRRGALAERLTQAGIATREVVIYDQERSDFSAEALAVLQGRTPVILPLFSPRTAQVFVEQATGSAPLFLVAISEAAMAPAAHTHAQERLIAPEPTASGMRSGIVEMLRRVEARGTAL